MKFLTISLKYFFAAKGAIYYVAIATVIFSHVKITCYFGCVAIHIPCDSISIIAFRFRLFRFDYVNAMHMFLNSYNRTWNVNNMHATLNPQFENSNRDKRIHSRLVRRHVWDPDKERVAHALLYLEILKGWLKDSIFTRQHKMAHKLLSSLLVNQKRTF